jgi:endo-1,4-beta-xylanase
VWAGSDGGLADRATMLERMRTHITTAGRPLQGKIRGWDVVNEALNDDGTLRDSPWRAASATTTSPGVRVRPRGRSGRRALLQRLQPRDEARQSAPAPIRIVKELQQRGLRIDAVGEQGTGGSTRRPPRRSTRRSPSCAPPA